ncbi:DUF1326 domain-containing protein [Anaeromyxobacter oryzae]|uniref:DUF1326 domain-containing protein n=1 Tax=Anaeromyxobacter oryzae TaxID=2918170 RepID=A0ABM7WNQ3_9BACT|nr:DUF1326 domain-containing protein [Anaeromyxobacter oryzae]BDG01093.1 hypothetical protein AMOR_00890 [Anaeromyxobacter oryzae]
MAGNWSVSGQYCEACNCEAACPCVVLGPPTTGECTVVIGWHIDRGRYEKVSLDGLNVALAAYAPGPMTQVKWKVALYVDDRANPEQRDALAKIFSGQAGGAPAALGPLVGEVLGVKSAAIEFRAEGKRRALRIDGVADAEIEAVSGQGGNDVTLSNHPFTAVPGFPAVVARSKRASYHDHGLALEVTGKNGFYSPFDYRP